MRDIVKLGAVLMIYALVSGAALAYSNIVTMPLIETNRLENENNARSDVLDGSDGGFEKRGEGSDFEYWVGFSDTEKSENTGYIFIARGYGYSSTIECMVGVDLSGAITGIKVLSQQETPGLGTKIQEVKYGDPDPWYTRQYIGKAIADDIHVSNDGGVIEAITGATISSRTVSNSIHLGLINLQETVGGFR